MVRKTHPPENDENLIVLPDEDICIFCPGNSARTTWAISADPYVLSGFVAYLTSQLEDTVCDPQDAEFDPYPAGLANLTRRIIAMRVGAPEEQYRKHACGQDCGPMLFHLSLPIL
ncbi:MAG: hypothetical protein JW741_21005, partial [Sedimentisphaerales bacterium]|nr:hypothetical protein [Sedimentisphaerales bacterium]